MKELQLVNEKSKCCGCGLCAIKCPKNAIELKEDEFGFIYPYIDSEKCINCGLCKKVCSYNGESKKSNFNKCKAVYAMQSKDTNVQKISSSGGAFYNVASMFLTSGGVVYGATMSISNNISSIKHIKVNSFEELYKLSTMTTS